MARVAAGAAPAQSCASLGGRRTGPETQCTGLGRARGARTTPDPQVPTRARGDTRAAAARGGGDPGGRGRPRPGRGQHRVRREAAPQQDPRALGAHDPPSRSRARRPGPRGPAPPAAALCDPLPRYLSGRAVAELQRPGCGRPIPSRGGARARTCDPEVPPRAGRGRGGRGPGPEQPRSGRRKRARGERRREGAAGGGSAACSDRDSHWGQGARSGRPRTPIAAARALGREVRAARAARARLKPRGQAGARGRAQVHLGARSAWGATERGEGGPWSPRIETLPRNEPLTQAPTQRPAGHG